MRKRLNTGCYYSFVLLFMTCSPALFAVTTIHTKQKLDVAIAFRGNDKFDSSTTDLIDGIVTAKLFLEQQHADAAIQLHYFNYNSNDIASVLSAAHKIIASKIPAVIGGEMSEEAMALGDVLNAHQRVLITPTASNPAVIQDKPFVFQVCLSDSDVAKGLATFVATNLKPHHLGVIDDVSLPYPDYHTKAFIAAYYNFMPNNLIVKKVLRQQVDYHTEINDFVTNKVTVVALLSYDIDLRRFYSQAAIQGFFPIYIGSDGWGDHEGLMKAIQHNSKNTNRFIAYRNYYWREDLATPLNRHFKYLFTKTYHKKPNAWNAIGFDTGWLLFTAMQRAGNPSDSTQIQKQLLNLRALQLVTSKNFAFKSDHSPQRDFYIYRVTAINVKRIQP